jgi:DNA-binding NarL/FixJ family response regulator
MPSVVTGEFEDLVAAGLAMLLDGDPDLDLVAHDVPKSQVREQLTRHSPDVLLLNSAELRAPGELLRLHQAFPSTRIVVLASRPTPDECEQLLSFGATACLSKETKARHIGRAIHLASRGVHVLPRGAARGGGLERLAMRGAELTARETEVLELLQSGATNSQIARELAIGIETVRTHARHIYRKLGIASRRDLARMARREPVVVDERRRPVSV